MTGAPSGVRNLFRAALLIFVITVVIGILNGTDVWDPPQNTLLTHVHAGTLGWITLSVFAAAIWMFGDPGSEETKNLANFSIVAMSLYVLAFWSGDIFNTTESIQRPIGGTLAFVAIVWMYVWILRRKRGQGYDVVEFGMNLAVLFLLIGAVLGVALGLQLADVEVVAGEVGTRLGDAHPAAMTIGYVVLAMLAIIEWRLRPNAPAMRESKSGTTQMSLMFLAGVAGMLGLLLDIEGLLIANTPLQVIGLGIFLWRMRSDLVPSAWKGSSISDRMLRTASLALILAVVLTAVVVNKFVAGGDTDEEALFAEVLPFLLALDHSTFVLVVSNVIFAMLAVGSSVTEASNRIIYWGLNIGALGFVVALIMESSPMKRIFTPILGLAILYGIWVHLSSSAVDETEPVPIS